MLCPEGLETQLEDNIRAVDVRLSEDEIRLLDASDPGVPYPKWMVLQLDTAEDPRSRALYPERYVDGGPWRTSAGPAERCYRKLNTFTKSKPASPPDAALVALSVSPTRLCSIAPCWSANGKLSGPPGGISPVKSACRK